MNVKLLLVRSIAGTAFAKSLKSLRLSPRIETFLNQPLLLLMLMTGHVLYVAALSICELSLIQSMP